MWTLRQLVVLAVLVLVLLPVNTAASAVDKVVKALPLEKPSASMLNLVMDPSQKVIPNDPIPPIGQRVTFEALGSAFFNNGGNITVSASGLDLNLTVQFTNATGIEFQVDGRIGQHGDLIISSTYQVFDVSSGQAFLSFYGTMTIQAQPVESSTGTSFQLFLTGPGRYENGNTGFHFFARLSGTLFNSNTSIGLLLVSGNAPSDVNMDGKVNIADLVSIGASFGTSYERTGYDAYADISMDGSVNLIDLVLVGGTFGTSYQ